MAIVTGCLAAPVKEGCATLASPTPTSSQSTNAILHQSLANPLAMTIASVQSIVRRHFGLGIGSSRLPPGVLGAHRRASAISLQNCKTLTFAHSAALEH